MEKIGSSSLWVEKYRPKTIKDLILPDNIKSLFEKFVKDGDIPNLIFTGSAGRGKTSTAYALARDIGMDELYINASMETGIDTLRSKVTNFAMTSSLVDAKKLVIADEFERTSAQGQDATKGLIEATEANCRFIFTTNNLSKIIDPIKSRCQLVDFNFSPKETKNMIVSMFKRVCWILDNEKVKYDKKVLAEFVQSTYPDFRKTLNELQKYVKMHDEIDDKIFLSSDQSVMGNLIEELKARKFNNIRKIATSLDPDQFYGDFYKQIEEYLDNSCKPTIILLLSQYVYESSLSVNKEITLMGFLVSLMKEAKWR